MSNTKLLGILNVTPDSFSDGGLFQNHDAAVRHGRKLFAQGADIIDVGGESNRPGAAPVSVKEELARVIPVVKTLCKEGIPVSIDTTKVHVAKQALENGACMINDISGFQDPCMQKLAAKWNVYACVMHMQGNPVTMQKNPVYPLGVIQTLIEFFQQKTRHLLSEGVSKDKILLDPGVGFGKTVEDNYKILNNLQTLRRCGYPLLIGLSRKSMLSQVLGTDSDPKQLAGPTLVMNTVAILGGADWIRVHDVKEHREAITLIKELEKARVAVACTHH